ncbi:MAG: hypothetical protein HQL87_14650 [Magnetococcales bacterium]|nr:hypothetical protein [Magnetococcales bacterium]
MQDSDLIRGCLENGWVAQKSNQDEVVTKLDLEMVKTELKCSLKELGLRLSAEMAPLRSGMAVCVGGIIALVLKTLFLQ